jgi:transcriptional regulator with XRE-family HTH domain
MAGVGSIPQDVARLAGWQPQESPKNRRAVGRTVFYALPMGRSKEAANPEFAASRMRELLRELVEEGRSRSAAADAIGLSRSYATKILTGERTTVGQAAVDTACRTLGIEAEFFAKGASDSYRNHVKVAGLVATPPPAAAAGKAPFADFQEIVDLLNWLTGKAHNFAPTLAEYDEEGLSPPGSPDFQRAIGASTSFIAYGFAASILASDFVADAKFVMRAHEEQRPEEALQRAGSVATKLRLLMLLTLAPDEERAAGLAALREHGADIGRTLEAGLSDTALDKRHPKNA